MKKLIIALSLLLLCIALFNSRVYAVSFVTYIDNFKQDNDTNTSGTFFEDPFDSIISTGGEPPDGPSGSSTYDVEGTFGSTRESSGKLELNLLDGITDEDGLFLGAMLDNSSWFFNSSDPGSVTGLFDITSDITPGAWFGIGIFNEPSSGSGEPDDDDAVFISIGKNEFGTWANWSDETSWVSGSPLGWVEITDLLGSSSVGMRLTLTPNTGPETGTSSVTAEFSFDGSAFVSLVPDSEDLNDFGISSEDFSTISFNQTSEVDDIYTGEFSAGEMPPPIPEPTTMALLGIGLAGLGGRYVRRRRKKKR